MNPDVVRAPPLHVALAKFGIMLAVGALIVLLAKVYFFPWMRGYLNTGTDHAEALYRLKIVLLGVGIFVLGLAGYVGWLGVLVLQQGQLPLAGSLVLRDTPVKRGRWVRACGILFVVLAVFLAADAICLAAFPYFLPTQ